MPRITTTVAVMVLLLNGTAGIMEISGLNDDLGVDQTTGVDHELSKIQEDLDGSFDPDVSVVESFITLAISAGRSFLLAVKSAFLAPQLIINLLGGGAFVTGVVAAFATPLYLIATLEIASVVVGNRTI